MSEPQILRAKCCNYCMYFNPSLFCNLLKQAVIPTEVCKKYTYKTEGGNYEN